VLTAGALAAGLLPLAACTRGPAAPQARPAGTRPPQSPPPQSGSPGTAAPPASGSADSAADAAVRAAAVAREQELLAAYDAALRGSARDTGAQDTGAQDPGARDTGAADAGLLRRLRAEHAEHLAALGGGQPSRTGSPPSRGGTRSRLRAAERAAAQAHARDALGASRQLAPVLAALAAAETSHLEALA